MSLASKASKFMPGLYLSEISPSTLISPFLDEFVTEE
jgi:hypothetical protein